MIWKPIHSILLATAIRTVFVASGLVILALSGSSLSQQPKSQREPMWKKVDDAVQKGLPKSAIEALGPIVDSAIAEKAYPEAIKAIAKRVLLEGQIEGAKPEEHIARMRTEIAKAQPEMLPVMHGIQAQFYWSYFEQNRWRFANRTATTSPPSDNFTTWDLPRLFAEIDSHYAKALANEAQLRNIPIASYDILFAKGTVSDSYRPTLFDFIAFSAIHFYSAGEQAGAKAEDAFEIEAASPAHGPTADFIAWTPVSTDALSPKLKAIQLYQRLLAIHQDDKDRNAYLDADLGRLEFAHANAVGEENGSRYKAALKSFAEANAKHELSATARHRWAVVLQSENELVEAREIATQGKNAFPQSVGGKLCFNTIADIEAKSLNVTTERVWNDPSPMLRVSYRNITKVYFRAVQVEWATRFSQDRWSPGTLNQIDRDQFVRQVPVLAWSADLPSTDDYRDATHDVPAPKELKPGYYFILTSANPDFSDSDNVISTCEVWVSNLALVLRQSWGSGKLEGFVLNAKTGEPIANAKVRMFVRQDRNNSVREAAAAAVSTNANGLFFVASNDRGAFLLASANGQELAVQNEQRTYSQPEQPTNFVQFVLFTDRSIYRPGQTIQWKGVCLIADTKKDKYATVRDREVSVQLRDVNGKEIERLKLRSNAFGSFTGSFTAPRDRGTGSMQIVVDDGRTGSAVVSVEEYKRPKFLVTLEAPKEAAKLNDEVTITGKATSYTGSAINGAKVRYRITRQVRWPTWFMYCYAWRMPPMLGSAQEISHGWATTEADGSFRVSFTAKPDASVPERDEPNFNYQITADVTDTTGETRTGTSSVTVGYTALQANVTAKEWLASDSDTKFSIITTTLDGTGQSANGTLKIYRLKEPASVLRSDILGQRIPPAPRGRGAAPGRPAKPANSSVLPDPSNQSTWALAEVASTNEFVTAADGKQNISLKLERGLYRAILESQDKYGKPVKSELNIRVVDPSTNKLGLKLANVLAAPKWELQPGEKLAAIWGTGYDSGRAFVEVEHRGKLLQSFWTKPGATQVPIAQDINEGMRGGFTVRTTFVRENRAYLESRHIDVPWSNKELILKWERFVSRIEPGRKETYTLTVSGPNASKAAAEMVAAMYDASLDAYLPHHWTQRLSMFRQDYSRLNSSFENNAQGLNLFRGQWTSNRLAIELRYRDFPQEFKVHFGYELMSGAMGGMGAGGGFRGRPMPASAAPEMMMEGAVMQKSANLRAAAMDFDAAGNGGAPGQPPGANPNNGPDLSQVSARKNLNETAFFFPNLITDAEGNIKLEFNMPEALTTWRFLGFAHDTELRSGYIEDKVITAKDLMIQPNPPRFLREGDILEFSVKVSNQSSQAQAGRVALNLFDARDNQSVDAAYGNVVQVQAFEIAAGESKSYHWKLNVPDGASPIIYKTVGATDKLSDGEEGMLPVLSKRILVTESMPLPIRGASTKQFEFKKLLESAKSDSLKHQSLTVQMVSQPAWYAVLALPYLMEFPYECSEQTFNRLYANHLAQHIANSDPKIRRVFDTWRNIQPEALVSPLSKNQDLKSVMIEETPWLRDADRESQSRRNVGILFDENRLKTEVERAMRKLTEMQRDNGMWPWFPGGPDNEYLSLYIVTGFGRMRQLGVSVDIAPALKALARLDTWMHERYDDIRLHSKDPEENHLTSTMALYLYGRSFFIKDMPLGAEHQVAIDYWKRQARNHWLKVSCRQSEAHIAIGLKRFGNLETPQDIVKSLRERSVSNEEMGMFWRDTERSWWWYHAPIETQALMIEAFDEVASDKAAVEDCKVWLLKQKQTQDWKTTKATADAVYALLLRGDNLLGSDALVQVKLADQTIKPENVEAGTGYYEEKFVRGEIKPEFGKLSLTKTDQGVSWGSIHWQYLEDIGKITPHDGTPLQLEKQLFKRVLTKSGPVLEPIASVPQGLRELSAADFARGPGEPIAGVVSVGDEVVCRITLRTDRDMEYVHMKDHRGSGTEPVNVLSQYRYQDGLAYYESTRDTASHFFIDYLPKGTYVFEYTIRVQHAGRYPTGMASIQCMYAAEFNSHSESILLNVGSAK